MVERYNFLPIQIEEIAVLLISKEKVAQHLGCSTGKNFHFIPLNLCFLESSYRK